MTNNILTNNNTTMDEVNSLINYVVSAAVLANGESVKIYNGYATEMNDLISKFQNAKSDERTELKWRAFTINRSFGYFDLGSLNPSRAEIDAKLELYRHIDKFFDMAGMDAFTRDWKEALNG